MDIRPILAAGMKISRAPRELEQLRNTVRMSLYLEVKSQNEKSCAGRFNKAECARMGVELVNRLCGETASSGSVAMKGNMAAAVEATLARIKSGESDLRVAASFMRWSKAVGLLMRLKNDEAEADLKEAIELNPKNAFALCSLAYLAGFQGESRRAIELARKALELDPGLTEAWIELGNAYEAGGEHGQAMAAWEKAQSLNPDMVQTKGQNQSPNLGLPGRDRPSRYEVLTDDPGQ